MTGKQAGTTIRMSLDLTPAMKQVIDEIVAEDHGTVAQVMRKAIALLKTVQDAGKRGESLALVDEAGTVTARIIAVWG